MNLSPREKLRRNRTPVNKSGKQKHSMQSKQAKEVVGLSAGMPPVIEAPQEEPTLTEEAFWGNVECAENLLKKLFPGESFELRVTVPGLAPSGNILVTRLITHYEGRDLYGDLQKTTPLAL